VIVAVADPLLPPLHETLVLAEMLAVPPDALLTRAVAVTVQLLISDTVTVYDPAITDAIVCVVCPPGAHE
jgi:hypothetical protein